MPPARHVALFLLFAAACGDDGPEDAASTTDATASTSAGSSSLTGADPSPQTTSSSTDPGTTQSTEDPSSADTSSSEGTGPGLGEGAMCDLYVQGCSDGFKCAPKLGAGGLAENVCVPVKGSATSGDPCTHNGVALGTDSCDESSLCYGELSFVEGWEGTCRAFCRGSVDDAVCELATEQCAGGLFPNCLPRCDPLVQDCQGPSEGCYFRGAIDSFVCMVSANAAQAGDPCETGTSCSPGTQCREAATVMGCGASGFCCAEYCDTEEAAACDGAVAGPECIAIGAFEPQFLSVGVCAIPL